MKVLLIGSGGREHAIAWKLSQSNKVEKIFCAPGNGGTAREEKCENVDITNIEGLLKFALENSIDITVVGPEAPLCEGVVDLFLENNQKIFGPSLAGANLEGSKIFAKEFMKKYNINTAEYSTFINPYDAMKYIEKCKFPVVIKADGLAAGKGVIIASNYDEAKDAIEEFMVSDTLKGAGKSIVIEEFLQGIEASILAITDGNTIIPFVSSKDHKAIYDGNLGPNTGGMGTIAPNPYCTEKVLEIFKNKIMQPTIQGLKEEKLYYKGIIFFGIMITKEDVYLIEYNVRMGDPETQVVLPLMENDFMELIIAALEDNLHSVEVKFKNQYACCIIASSKGYPNKYDTGKDIIISNHGSEKVFIAGGKEANNKLVTSGGRVLGVTALGVSLEEARINAYKGIKNVDFEGIYYRQDIGL